MVEPTCLFYSSSILPSFCICSTPKPEVSFGSTPQQALALVLVWVLNNLSTWIVTQSITLKMISTSSTNGMDHKVTYDVLSILAKDVLSMPMSIFHHILKSTFSLPGRIIDERRWLLVPKMVEMLFCIKGWETVWQYSSMGWRTRTLKPYLMIWILMSQMCNFFVYLCWTLELYSS